MAFITPWKRLHLNSYNWRFSKSTMGSMYKKNSNSRIHLVLGDHLNQMCQNIFPAYYVLQYNLAALTFRSDKYRTKCGNIKKREWQVKGLLKLCFCQKLSTCHSLIVPGLYWFIKKKIHWIIYLLQYLPCVTHSGLGVSILPFSKQHKCTEQKLCDYGKHTMVVSHRWLPVDSKHSYHATTPTKKESCHRHSKNKPWPPCLTNVLHLLFFYIWNWNSIAKYKSLVYTVHDHCFYHLTSCRNFRLWLKQITMKTVFKGKGPSVGDNW